MRTPSACAAGDGRHSGQGSVDQAVAFTVRFGQEPGPHAGQFRVLLGDSFSLGGSLSGPVDGAAVEPVPPPPRDLAVAAIVGGSFRLRWSFVPSLHLERVADFRVYSNGGAGDVDYDTPIATVSARSVLRGRGFYAWDSDPFDHAATVIWAVRSRSAAGNEETNTTEIAATADAEGPADHRVLAAS